MFVAKGDLRAEGGNAKDQSSPGQQLQLADCSMFLSTGESGVIRALLVFDELYAQKPPRGLSI